MKAANDAAKGDDASLEAAVDTLYVAMAEHIVRGGLVSWNIHILKLTIWRDNPLYLLDLQSLWKL